MKRTLPSILTLLLLAGCSTTASASTDDIQGSTDFATVLSATWQSDDPLAGLVLDEEGSFARWSVEEDRLTDWVEGTWQQSGNEITLVRTSVDGEEVDESNRKVVLQVTSSRNRALKDGHFIWISQDGDELVWSRNEYSREDGGLAGSVFEGLKNPPDHEIGVLEDGTFFDYAIRIAENDTRDLLASAPRQDEENTLSFKKNGTFTLSETEEVIEEEIDEADGEETEEEEKEEAKPLVEGEYSITTEDSGQVVHMTYTKDGKEETRELKVAENADQALQSRDYIYISADEVIWNQTSYKVAQEEAQIVDELPEGAISGTELMG